MKFYTIEFNDKQYVAVEKGDRRLVSLESMGMKPPVFLKKGDVVRCEISGIGSLVNRVGT